MAFDADPGHRLAARGISHGANDRLGGSCVKGEIAAEDLPHQPFAVAPSMETQVMRQRFHFPRCDCELRGRDRVSRQPKSRNALGSDPRQGKTPVWVRNDW